jgi:hypothetical protein
VEEHVFTEQDCMPNLNMATIAGKVISVELLAGKTPGLRFVVGYTKTWPSGGTSEIPIRCYITGAEQVEKLSWLNTGEVVLIKGEVTDKNAVYAHVVQHLSKPEREPGSNDDAYVTGMSRGR